MSWPTQKEALALYEFFSPGTKTDVILLGEPTKVSVHHVKSKRHKILCTATTGSCEGCQVCGSSLDVSDAQLEYHVPAMRLKKDRRHHQCIAVFTSKQFDEQVDPLMREEGSRGLRLEVARESSQKCVIKPVKGSPSTLSLRLPESFNLLPWARARWTKPQDAAIPAVRLEPFTLREVEYGPPRAVKPLELTSDDRLTAEEFEKTKAKLAEAKAMFLAPTTPLAPVPTEPKPTPASVSIPETSAPNKTITFVVKNQNPADVERNLAERQAAEEARRAALENTGNGSLRLSTDILNGLSETFSVPADRQEKAPVLNGKHTAKKGGGK